MKKLTPDELLEQLDIEEYSPSEDVAEESIEVPSSLIEMVESVVSEKLAEKRGDDGRGIDDVRINHLGHLIVTYSDGTSKSLGNVRGQDGITQVLHGGQSTGISIKENSITIGNSLTGINFLGDVDVTLNGSVANVDVTGGSGGAVDSVNGQTGVVVLDTGDVADSTNKRYVTDAQLTVIGNTSGTNTGDQDLSGLVPYTGASGDVTLGTHKITASAVQANSSAGGELRTNGGTAALHWGSGGSANGTLYGGWNYDNATADTIASFGASKTLTSLALATYPSLTELSYVKGVTSAIQTQLNGKQATGNYITDLTGDVTATGGGSVAGTIANDAVTYAKMQNVSAASKLIGRGDGGSGDPQEITLGTNLSMSGTTLNATGGGLTTGQSLALARGMALN